MTRELQFKRRPAASGKTGSVVLFLHGYGADGADLLGLADPLGPHLRDTVFIAPDAPETCTGNPMGYQWFPIPWIDGSDVKQMERGLEAAAHDLDAFIDQVLEQEGVGPDKLIVVGFSQGTMLALDVLPRREAPVAGLVAFSGRIIDPQSFGEEVVCRPPVLVVHGDKDEVVPPGHFNETGQALEAAGFEVFGHVMEGTGHGISPDGLSVALAFMAQRLGVELGEGEAE